MEFKEKSTLWQRNATGQDPDAAVETFLIGSKSVAGWECNESQYGWDSASLFPAWVGGVRKWVLRLTWCAAQGYCADGIEEKIISFEDGLREIINHGDWKFFETGGQNEL